MGGRIGDKKVEQRGAIERQIFEQVEQLTAGGAMNRLAAFKRIAETGGRQLGTVAANYYRVARQKGVPLRKRRQGRPSRPGLDVSRVTAALQLIASALRAQEEELARLPERGSRDGEGSAVASQVSVLDHHGRSPALISAREVVDASSTNRPIVTQRSLAELPLKRQIQVVAEKPAVLRFSLMLQGFSDAWGRPSCSRVFTHFHPLYRYKNRYKP